ncbi:ATP-dependent endonuclease [Paramixta manurensis]|uniref:ATP-dependent endonuclease n=1 Tax=Paramixta manurensis TaxID=2740817 RepID=A0A6M8UMP7_9GAMM|nr:ATP-dependent endonuclease [Erwiniaceae bacterium PD-1]
MMLEQIEIVGFRGINRLSLSLTESNVLIGENAWGKSSLLDALTLMLTPQETLYLFTRHDFHFPPGNQNGHGDHLTLRFTFREEPRDHQRISGDATLSLLWQQGTDGVRRIFYQVEGRINPQQQVVTLRRFLRTDGEPLSEQASEQQVRTLMRLFPVLRLRDARFNHRLRQETPTAHSVETLGKLTDEINALTRDLVTRPQNLTDTALRQGLLTMQQLLEHYFSVQSSPGVEPRVRAVSTSRDSRHGWRYLGNINQLIANADSRSRQLIVLRMFALLVQARGAQRLDPDARPLLLVEDPETRLHPIMLSVAWELLELLPLQKIATTNSSELLSQVPVEQVCRLVREPNRVATWRIGPAGMSQEESRRIAFHIRVNRPSALFARCWLLVEGETEVWVMNELARQCGYRFEAEGIKVIEFAQAGLRPLLKFAQRMGIEWHVLTDGDEAGKKYAATTRGLLQDSADDERRHLTVLPALDMEHFLYRQGFSDVYHRVAHVPVNVPMNMRRIITKAIQRSSKPELAITVAMDAAERGIESIPPLLRQMFGQVLWLARGKAD